MASGIYNVSDARRALPRLVREASAGTGPIRIGRRGRAEAVLVSAEDYEELQQRRREATPRGTWAALRLDLVGTPGELEIAMKEIRGEVSESLERRLDRIVTPSRRPRQR